MEDGQREASICFPSNGNNNNNNLDSGRQPTHGREADNNDEQIVFACRTTSTTRTRAGQILRPHRRWAKGLK